MLIETLSVFPEMFEPIMSTSILGRARKAGLFDFKAYNLRDWTHDRHPTVDDEPYGGGQGMLMKVEPIAAAIEAISSEGPKPTVVFFTPCGEPFTQHVAERLLKSERLLFVCSRYEGVDERAYAYADERLSIGDYGRRTSRYGRCRCRRTPDSWRPGRRDEQCGRVVLDRRGRRPARVRAVHPSRRVQRRGRAAGAREWRSRQGRCLASQERHRAHLPLASRSDRDASYSQSEE